MSNNTPGQQHFTLTLKIEELVKEQAQLKNSLSQKFNAEDYRRLNIINQHIIVSKSRLKGDWGRGNYPEHSTISK